MIIADARLDSARAVAEEIKGKGIAINAIEYDAGSEESVNAMVNSVFSNNGRIDILVNGAYKFIEKRIDGGLCG